jgi:serine/threonine-protein kinase
VPPADRKARAASIEQRYRYPAMVHLRAALADRDGSPAYLEALIAFHDHRFAEASEKAHAVFAGSPTFFEAGALEARARKAQGDQLLPTGKIDEAKAEFAAARRIFQSVLEVARSDDEMWLGYAEMVFAQAVSLTRGGEISAELRQEIVAALRNVQRINPDDGKAFLREAQIHTAQGNNEILWYRDPGPYVDKALALAEQARAHGVDAAEVDEQVCLAHWEQAGYQGSHGGDPHPSFARALTACERALAARPDADRHDSLGAVQCWLAVYEGDHGHDPARLFESCERNFRSAFALGDTPGAHYSLGRLWTMVAHQRVRHGEAPVRAVDDALAEYAATVKLTATRPDAWVEMANALVARAQFELHEHHDTQDTLTRARAAIERALAVEPSNVPAVRYRIMLDDVEVEELVRRNLDPGPTLARIRADVQLLSSRAPTDSVAHLLAARAELVAARWALARRDMVDQSLARAESQAARARDDDPRNALAWTASAEIEQVRIAAARTRRTPPDRAAVIRGLACIERALAIDPRLVRALEVRDELARQSQLVR